jgi:bacteriorhodopsin
MAGNHALDVNPPDAFYHLSRHGSDWLWAVTAIYSIILLSWIVWSFRARFNEKTLHYLLIVAGFTGSIAYFTMASDLGSTPVPTRYNNHGNPGATRQIWYARYINWFVGWAAIIIATLLVSAVSWSTIFFTVAIEWVWVVSWLSGALVHSSYKWGYFVFGFVAYLVLVHQLLFVGLRNARAVGIHGNYTLATGFLVFVWLLYSIAWGLDEGGNKITVTHAFVFYGILDLLTVPIWGILFLFFAHSWDYDSLGLHYTERNRLGRRNPAAIGGEKSTNGHGTAAGTV